MTAITNVDWIPRAQLAIDLVHGAAEELQSALFEYGRGPMPTPQGEAFAARGEKSIKTLKTIAKGLVNALAETAGGSTP